MRLAISNIAWPAEEEAAAADLLVREGAEGVEIAPTKVWPHPLEATDAEVSAYRRFWEKRDLPVVAMQALLFERPDLQIFEGARLRRAAFDYLAAVIGLAGKLGVAALVFGSPKNRAVGSQTPDQVAPVALDFFRRIGEVARGRRTVFCIEPNPTCYSCDYVTTAREGLELVRQVNHPGFGLHLDAAAMTLSGDPLAETFEAGRPWWRHFHISEPYLGPVGQGTSNHAAIADAVRGAGYDGWVSIEMKAVAGGDHLRNVETALRYGRQTYLGSPAPAQARRTA